MIGIVPLVFRKTYQNRFRNQKWMQNVFFLLHKIFLKKTEIRIWYDWILEKLFILELNWKRKESSISLSTWSTLISTYDYCLRCLRNVHVNVKQFYIHSLVFIKNSNVWNSIIPFWTSLHNQIIHNNIGIKFRACILHWTTIKLLSIIEISLWFYRMC